MKTTKKIFAALLAVMMILMMVPFSVSAADVPTTATLNLSWEKAEYTFVVYKVATLDMEAGKYEAVSTDEDVIADINDVTVGAADMIATLEGSSDPGEVVKTIVTTGASNTTITGLPYGIYFVKATKYPESIKKSQSSLVVAPEFEAGVWKNYEVSIDLGEKYSSSDAESDKKILLENGSLVDASTTGYGEEVTFKLNASVVGSTEKKLKEYAIVDNMSNGLTFGEITAVYLADIDGNKINDITYEYTKDAIVKGTKYTFAVVLGDDILADDSFYSAAQVVVEYTATVNKEAAIGAPIPNTSKLVYQNSEEDWAETSKVEVNVFTAGLQVKKTDAKTDAPLQNAVFGVYTDKACASDPIATATTNEYGYGLFMKAENDKYKFASGTYYVKEITAPAGYILSTEVTTVVIKTEADGTSKTMTLSLGGSDSNVSDATGGIVQVAAKNSPVKLPSTGGMGTMMFTIGGAALIACAGVLLFVLKRKAQ